MDDPTAMDEADLLRRQTHTIVTIYGGETVWIGDIVGDDPERALVSLGLLDVTIRGTLADVRDRLQAAVRLLDEAVERPEDWDLLLARRKRLDPRARRTWAHPFRDPDPGPPASS